MMHNIYEKCKRCTDIPNCPSFSYDESQEVLRSAPSMCDAAVALVNMGVLKERERVKYAKAKAKKH